MKTAQMTLVEVYRREKELRSIPDWRKTPAELDEEDSNDKTNAFIEGVQWACEQLGIDDYRQYDEEKDVQPAECGNCEWSGIAGDAVQPIPDLEQRIEAGSEVPVGECPSCGAL